MSPFPEAEWPPREPATPAEAAPPPHPAWSGGDVLRITLLAIFAIFLASTLAFVIALRLPAFADMEPAEVAADARVLVPAQTAAYLLIFLVMYVTVSVRARTGFWEAMQWRWPVGGRVLTYLLLGIALSAGVQAASQVLPIPRDLPIERMFRDTMTAYILAVFGTAIAPLMEEMFFRGLLYPVLERRLGMGAGVAITSAAFAVIHSAQLGTAWAPLLLLFGVGTAITLVRACTGSVAAGFLVHLAYNGFIFALMWVATGGFRHLERLSGS